MIIHGYSIASFIFCKSVDDLKMEMGVELFDRMNKTRQQPCRLADHTCLNHLDNATNN